MWVVCATRLGWSVVAVAWGKSRHSAAMQVTPGQPRRFCMTMGATRRRDWHALAGSSCNNGDQLPASRHRASCSRELSVVHSIVPVGFTARMVPPDASPQARYLWLNVAVARGVQVHAKGGDRARVARYLCEGSDLRRYQMQPEPPPQAICGLRGTAAMIDSNRSGEGLPSGLTPARSRLKRSPADDEGDANHTVG